VTVNLEKLDREVLDWIAAHTGDVALSAHIEAAAAKKRDYMRTGCFVYFEPRPELAVIDAAVRPVCPHVTSPELMDGAGCSLFLRNGQLHYLEIYSRGGFIPEQLESFELGGPEKG
jgi:hypothetical protein